MSSDYICTFDNEEDNLDNIYFSENIRNIMTGGHKIRISLQDNTDKEAIPAVFRLELYKKIEVKNPFDKQRRESLKKKSGSKSFKGNSTYG